MTVAGGAMALLPQSAESQAAAARQPQPLIAIEDDFGHPLPPAAVPAFIPAAEEPAEPAPATDATPTASLAPSTSSPAARAIVPPEPSVPLVPEAMDINELPRFDGRPIRPVRTLTMVVTAYSPDAASCAPFDDGITASGYSVHTNGGRLVAADTDLLPLGTIVTIPGYNDGLPVPVLDRGGAIKGNRLDVLYATHDRALQWGVKKIEVVVWDYAD